MSHTRRFMEAGTEEKQPTSPRTRHSLNQEEPESLVVRFLPSSARIAEKRSAPVLPKPANETAGAGYFGEFERRILREGDSVAERDKFEPSDDLIKR